MPDPISFEFAWPYLAGALVIGYLIGSIPFGLVLTRIAGYGDVRRIGSGNIGATNVLRTGNKGLALATLLLDGGKGAVAVLFGYRYGQDIAIVAGAGAMLGHIFPFWLGFRGGKGVATALGILLAIAPVVGALACLTWLLVAILFRYSSLAAIAALALAPVYGYAIAYGPWGHLNLVDPQRAEFMIFIAALSIARHAGNLRRLWRGEESKI